MTILYQPKQMMSIVFRIRGSVFLRIKSLIVYSIFVSLLACILTRHIDDSHPPYGKSLSTTGLSFLLSPLTFLIVFSTNTASQRFWSARSCTSSLFSDILGFTRMFCCYVHGETAQHREVRLTFMRLTSLLLTLSIREILQFDVESSPEQLPPPSPNATGTSEPFFKTRAESPAGGPKESEELDDAFDNSISFITKKELEILTSHRGRRGILNQSSTVTVGQWLLMMITTCEELGLIESHVALAMDRVLSDALHSAHEAISLRANPIPYPYIQLLNFILVVAMFLVPCTVVTERDIIVFSVTVILTSVLGGIAEVGGDITDPFGDSPNDFPLNEMGFEVLGSMAAMMHQRQPFSAEDHEMLRNPYQHDGQADSFRTVLATITRYCSCFKCQHCGASKETTPCCTVTGLFHADDGNKADNIDNGVDNAIKDENQAAQRIQKMWKKKTPADNNNNNNNNDKNQTRKRFVTILPDGFESPRHRKKGEAPTKGNFRKTTASNFITNDNINTANEVKNNNNDNDNFEAGNMVACDTASDTSFNSS